MEIHKRKGGHGRDKDPYDRREDKVTAKAFKSVDKSVKPVAKDTNKTRRKMVLPTATGTRSPKSEFPKQRK
jgi:hypothetical protein